MLIVTITTEVLLEDGVNSFGLAICLRVISSREVLFDLEDLAEFLGEARGENRAAVRDNRRRETVEPENPVNKKGGKFLGVIIRAAGDKVGHLGEAVHNYPDSIVAIGVWEANDEVARNFFPTPFRDLKRLEETKGWMSDRLDSCTGIAIPNKSGYGFAHTGPPVGP